jgi:hypothetical protein
LRVSAFSKQARACSRFAAVLQFQPDPGPGARAGGLVQQGARPERGVVPPIVAGAAPRSTRRNGKGQRDGRSRAPREFPRQRIRRGQREPDGRSNKDSVRHRMCSGARLDTGRRPPTSSRSQCQQLAPTAQQAGAAHRSEQRQPPSARRGSLNLCTGATT